MCADGEKGPHLTLCGESGSDEVGGARGLEGVGTAGQELGPGLWSASKVLGHLGLALCGHSSLSDTALSKLRMGM